MRSLLLSTSVCNEKITSFWKCFPSSSCCTHIVHVVRISCSKNHCNLSHSFFLMKYILQDKYSGSPESTSLSTHELTEQYSSMTRCLTLVLSLHLVEWEEKAVRYNTILQLMSVQNVREDMFWKWPVTQSSASVSPWWDSLAGLCCFQFDNMLKNISSMQSATSPMGSSSACFTDVAEPDASHKGEHAFLVWMSPVMSKPQPFTSIINWTAGPQSSVQIVWIRLTD